jgi:hypothetical protein
LVCLSITRRLLRKSYILFSLAAQFYVRSCIVSVGLGRQDGDGEGERGKPLTVEAGGSVSRGLALHRSGNDCAIASICQGAELLTVPHTHAPSSRQPNLAGGAIPFEFQCRSRADDYDGGFFGPAPRFSRYISLSSPAQKHSKILKRSQAHQLSAEKMFRYGVRRITTSSALRAAAAAAAEPSQHTINVSTAQGVARGLTGGAQSRRVGETPT